MTKSYQKKEIVYYVNKDCNDEIARKLRADLYDTYEDVQIYSNGLHDSRIICTIK